MPQISNIGGSLTSAVVLTLLAWGVRLLRATAQRSQGPSRKGSSAELGGTLPRFFAALTPAALRKLIELDAIPHVLIAVRDADQLPPRELPAELSSAVEVTEDQIGRVLSGKEGAWPARVGGPPPPTKGHLLVLLMEGRSEPRGAASAAAAAGFQRVAYLAGGIGAFSQQQNNGLADLRFINRDAAALLLSRSASNGSDGSGGLAFIDVRRHDERTLYGSIPRALHIPVDELPAALQLSSSEWAERYRFPKPGAGAPVVFQCRTNRRASWAAQLAADAGLGPVFVYKQGVYGWRLDPNVKSYPSYEQWEAPPDPENVQLESVNVAAGREELESLGLAPPRSMDGRSTR